MAGDFNERFMHSVGRHFVTLSCVQFLAENKERVLVFSGFLVEAGGVWFYITAGHILRDLRDAIGKGAKFDVWRLGDQTAPRKERFKDSGIPYDFDINRWLVLADDSVGLDYAAVPLRMLDCKQLAAGDAEPISRIAWGDYVTEHDQWALVGVPSETVSYDGKTLITARAVVAPLVQVDPPIQDAKVQNRFFGQLKDDSERVVKDIDGMSGGPIFALKKIEGTWKYHVIGVQSAWYPRLRIIAACPFSSLGFELEKVVEIARASIT
jgi:hypothetical protein